jgi:hypothetical protein
MEFKHQLSVHSIIFDMRTHVSEPLEGNIILLDLIESMGPPLPNQEMAI